MAEKYKGPKNPTWVHPIANNAVAASLALPGSGILLVFIAKAVIRPRVVRPRILKGKTVIF
jgi:hypothetical protein